MLRSLVRAYDTGKQLLSILLTEARFRLLMEQDTDNYLVCRIVGFADVFCLEALQKSTNHPHNIPWTSNLASAIVFVGIEAARDELRARTSKIDSGDLFVLPIASAWLLQKVLEGKQVGKVEKARKKHVSR